MGVFPDGLLDISLNINTENGSAKADRSWNDDGRRFSGSRKTKKNNVTGGLCRLMYDSVSDFSKDHAVHFIPFFFRQSGDIHSKLFVILKVRNHPAVCLAIPCVIVVVAAASGFIGI